MSNVIEKDFGPKKPDEPDIISFFHCGECLKERPDEFSPREWAQIEVGWTKKGFQIWCKRHEMNIANFDMEGHKVSTI